jgi:hypothetical protein
MLTLTSGGMPSAASGEILLLKSLRALLHHAVRVKHKLFCCSGIERL